MGRGMARHKSTVSDFALAVRDSFSIAEVLRRLRLRGAGGNYATVKRLVRERKLDVSHWTGQGHRKGSTIPVVRPRPLDAVLVRDLPVNSHSLRRRLIREGLMSPICSNCGLSEWQGMPIPLELDHRDGDRNNQELANLRLLCPNCHALTPTYRGRNRKGRSAAKMLPTAGSDIMAANARVVELVDTRDLRNLSPLGETPKVNLVKVGESPGGDSEPTPSQASDSRKV